MYVSVKLIGSRENYANMQTLYFLDKESVKIIIHLIN